MCEQTVLCSLILNSVAIVQYEAKSTTGMGKLEGK